MRRPLRQIRSDMRSLLHNLDFLHEVQAPVNTVEYFLREYAAVSREYDLRMMLVPHV